MSPSDTVPAVLLMWDIAGQFCTLDTNTVPYMLSPVAEAVAELQESRPAMVAAGDRDATLAAWLGNDRQMTGEYGEMTGA